MRYPLPIAINAREAHVDDSWTEFNRQYLTAAIAEVRTAERQEHLGWRPKSAASRAALILQIAEALFER